MGYLIVRAGARTPVLEVGVRGKINLKKVSSKNFVYKGVIPVKRWDLYEIIKGEPYWWHCATIKVKTKRGTMLLLRQTQDVLGIQNGSPEIILNRRICPVCHKGNAKREVFRDRRDNSLFIIYTCANKSCRHKWYMTKPAPKEKRKKSAHKPAYN